MSVRIQSKRLFLTYSQCTLSKQTLYDHLLLLSYPIEKLLVAEETHEDGGTHFHAIVIFKSKPNIRNASYFDVRDFHPKWEILRSLADAIKYTTKEDATPLSNFDYKSLCKKGKKEAVDYILKSCDEGTHPDEILVGCIKLFPELLSSATSLGYFIARAAKGVHMFLPIYEFNTFALSTTDKARIELWAETVRTMVRGHRIGMRSMWFLGDTRLGKTALARSIGPHWYMQSNWNLTNICDQPGVYGVLDDIEWDFIKNFYKGILGCQSEVDLCDKFYRKKRYQLGYPVIVCTNEAPVVDNSVATWLRGNVDFYKLKSAVTPNSIITPFERFII